VALRPYLLGNINMCWVLGQLTGTGVVHAMISDPSTWSYRLPFALQWAWAVPLTVIVTFAPEGPWWLIRHGRDADARHALTRLTKKANPHIDIDQMIAVMRFTDATEKRLSPGASSSYGDCFRGTNRRRTEIAAMVWLTQALCGAALIGYAPYFYEQAGFDTRNSFRLSTGTFGLAMIGGVMSWLLLRRMGRRLIYLTGLGALFALLVAAGIVSATLPTRPGGNWIVGSLVVALVFVYSVTIGPACYVMVAEIPSTRLRVKTVVLARVAYNLATLVNNVLTPFMLNPTEWNWGGRTCLWYAGTAMICFAWAMIRLPETRGLSYIELDILFDKKAPAAKFDQLRVNLENCGYLSLNKIERSTLVWHGWQGYS
jgi:MFS transporter, SP family, general alpha glucoside:H+ symporter